MHDREAAICTPMRAVRITCVPQKAITAAAGRGCEFFFSSFFGPRQRSGPGLERSRTFQTLKPPPRIGKKPPAATAHPWLPLAADSLAPPPDRAGSSCDACRRPRRQLPHPPAYKLTAASADSRARGVGAEGAWRQASKSRVDEEAKCGTPNPHRVNWLLTFSSSAASTAANLSCSKFQLNKKPIK